MADFTPHEAPATDALSLPVVPPAKLIGRDDTLRSIYADLRESKPVLLYGVPGIGKSALAATLASAYTDLPGGVLYLTVRNNTFADLIARIGRAYRNNDITLSDSPGNMAPAAADLLASKRPLVVLDGLLNPQATSEFLQRCIRNIPVLLVNEAEISGSWRGQRLGKLEPSHAQVMLKTIIEQAVETTDEELDSLAETLGYTPFALSIAGHWIKASKQPASAFVAQIPKPTSADVSPSLLALTASFRSLTGGANNALQGLLLVLGATFTGSASAEMIAMIAGAPVEVINNALGMLVQRGLLERSKRYGQPYYRLHDITYTFLQTWLRGSKGLESLQGKVRDAVLAYAKKYGDSARTTPTDPIPGDRLAAEMDLILATAQWAADNGDRDVANQLAPTLMTAGSFISERGYTYEVLLLRRLGSTSTSAFPAYETPAPLPTAAQGQSDAAPEADDEDEDDLIDEVDEIVEDALDNDDDDDQDDLDLEAEIEDEDEADLDEDEDSEDDEIDSVPIPFADSEAPDQQRLDVIRARQSGDRREQAESLSTLARTQAGEGKHIEAIASYSDALNLYEALNDTPGILSTLEALAGLTIATENSQAAVLHATRGIHTALDVGNDIARMNLLTALGDARQQLGESEEALRAYESALELARSEEDSAKEASILYKLGYAQLDDGNSNEAIDAWEKALTLYKAQGNRAQEGKTIGGIGTANGELDRWTEAIGFYGSALHIAREVKDQDEEFLELTNLAYAHVQANQLGQAVLRYRQALHIAYTTADEEAIISVTVDLARLLVESPRHLSIAELLVDEALKLDSTDRDLRRLKERIEDEKDAFGDDFEYKTVKGTAQDYAANAAAME